MIQKKICMLGAFAVGKTSLVQRYVQGNFSEKYLTTVGVKIDRRTVTVGAREVGLVLWDIHGEDELQKVRMSYLRGAAGYFLVVDGTRAATLEVALGLMEKARETADEVPVVLLVNKVDLAEEWEVDRARLDELAAGGLSVMKTSAKTGERVEDAFVELARRMIDA